MCKGMTGRKDDETQAGACVNNTTQHTCSSAGAYSCASLCRVAAAARRSAGRLLVRASSSSGRCFATGTALGANSTSCCANSTCTHSGGNETMVQL